MARGLHSGALAPGALLFLSPAAPLGCPCAHAPTSAASATVAAQTARAVEPRAQRSAGRAGRRPWIFQPDPTEEPRSSATATPQARLKQAGRAPGAEGTAAAATTRGVKTAIGGRPAQRNAVAAGGPPPGAHLARPLWPALARSRRAKRTPGFRRRCARPRAATTRQAYRPRFMRASVKATTDQPKESSLTSQPRAVLRLKIHVWTNQRAGFVRNRQRRLIEHRAKKPRGVGRAMFSSLSGIVLVCACVHRWRNFLRGGLPRIGTFEGYATCPVGRVVTYPL